MTLKDRITEDMKDAMRAKDAPRLSTIRLLLAACKQREVDAAVRALVAELAAAGPGDMGRVMGAAKARLAGKADMALVSAAVRQALAKT